MKKKKSNKQIEFLGFGELSIHIVTTFNIKKENYTMFDDNNSGLSFNSYLEYLDKYNL